MSVLRLRDVHYTYSAGSMRVDALRGVTCDFEQGKVYAVVGKSGSGKTTLLSLIAGLDLPGEGVVEYMGKPTSGMNLNRYRRESVSVIYQNFRLFPLLTALENVMYPMELRRMKPRAAKEKAGELINKVGLDSGTFNRFPNMLSGGEQQRVAIARALAMDTKIILADEPTGNLDVQNSENIINILVNLAKQDGYCVIIVTHDTGILDKTEIVMRMEDGRIKHSPE